jgi:hypothetical protein
MYNNSIFEVEIFFQANHTISERKTYIDLVKLLLPLP